MNTETLDELLDRYEANLDMLYNDENNELFKWRALKTFQSATVGLFGCGRWAVAPAQSILPDGDG